AAHETELRGRLGVPLARRLLESDDPRERQRGVVRLGAIGTTEAIDALVEVVEGSGPVAHDTRARLLAVRVLAPHARRDGVRQLLLREAMEASGSEARGALTPLAGVVRGTAALALAKSGDKKALVGLASAVLQGGAPAEAALAALAAYPPASIEPLLENRHRLTPQLATMLADLGDVRAIERLRVVIAEPDVGARVSAAATLARLGDASALPLARAWLATSDPRLRRGAAEVLVALEAPEQGAAVASLVANDATRDVGVRLALASPSPAAGAALARVLGELPELQRPGVVAAMGRAGPALVPSLVKLVDGEELGVSAALALARMPGAEAREALERGLVSAKSGAARRLFVRAGLVRAIELDDAPAGLRAVVKALASEGRADDASLGVFGLVAIGAASASSAIERACGGSPEPGKACAPELVAAAARGALARGRSADLDAFAALLDPARDPRVVAAAGVALLAEDGAAHVTTADLVAWTETSAPLAPLAARALAARDTPALRSRIKRLLDGGDPVVRAHVALGLARSAEADAVTLLV
ncbi:MAG TPA: HEAT repeat domain-containing protein, partial [Byssovorax sp.]